MNRTLIFTIIAISLALGWLAFEQSRKSHRDEQTVAELQLARDTAAVAAEKAKSELIRQKEITSRLTRERDEALQNEATTPAADETSGRLTNAAAGILDGDAISPAMRDAMRSMMKARTLEQFSSDYAPLFKRWNLSESDMNRLLGLLPGLETGTAGYLVTHPEAAGLKPEAIAAAAEKIRAETRGKLNALLGAELAAELDSFTGELKVNEAVAPYTKHLDLVGAPMSQEQKSMLAAAISGAAGGNVPASPGSVPADVLRRQHEAQQAEIIQKAGSFLSPEQITALQTVFTRKNDEQEAVGKMIDEVMKDED